MFTFIGVGTVFSIADRSKLDGIEPGAQVNPASTDELPEGAINKYVDVDTQAALYGAQNPLNAGNPVADLLSLLSVPYLGDVQRIQYIKTTLGAPTGIAGYTVHCLNTSENKIYNFDGVSAWDAGGAVSDKAKFVFHENGTDTSGDNGTYTADNKIRIFSGGIWSALTPAAGWLLRTKIETGKYLEYLAFNGTGWVNFFLDQENAAWLAAALYGKNLIYINILNVLTQSWQSILSAGSLRRRRIGDILGFHGPYTLSGAAHAVNLDIPAGARILNLGVRVENTITSGDGGTSFDVDFTGGSSQKIMATKGFAIANHNALYDTAVGLTTGVTDLLITCNGGTFNGGVLYIEGFYEDAI